MRRKIGPVLAAILTTLTSIASAQTTPRPASGLLTLDSALGAARVHSPHLEVASARRMIAEGRARADGAFPNPLFEWRQENLGSSLQPDIFATVQVPIDLTGRRLKQRSAIGAGLLRGRADSAATVRTLEYDVARAFWNAALAEALYAVSQSDVEARQKLATTDSARAREGIVAEVVAIRTRLEASRALGAQMSALQEMQKARGALARLIGLPVDSLPPLAPLPLLGALRVDAPPADVQAFETAMRLRPDVQAARYAAQEAMKRSSAERRGVMSDLQFVSGYKQTSGINSGVLGLAVPLPVFSRNEGVSLRSRGESVMASAELRDLELRVRGEVHAAVEAYTAMRSALTTRIVAMETDADEIASIAEGAYREGAISLTEVVDAQRTRAESRANALRWAAGILLTIIDYKMATGESFSGGAI